MKFEEMFAGDARSLDAIRRFESERARDVPAIERVLLLCSSTIDLFGGKSWAAFDGSVLTITFRLRERPGISDREQYGSQFGFLVNNICRSVARGQDVDVAFHDVHREINRAITELINLHMQKTIRRDGDDLPEMPRLP